MSNIPGVNSMPVLDDSRTISAMVSNNEIANILRNVSNVLDDTNFAEFIDGWVNIDHKSAVNASTAKSTKRHSKVTPTELSTRWGIGLEAAKQTLKASTQRTIRTAVQPLHCRYRSK